jgi:hypothetical protein
MSTSDAIEALERYVRLCGCDPGQWCAGIAADPVDRLLREHGVAEEGDGCGWITYHCATHQLAREARDHFLARGMKAAAPAGGDGAATSVYLFRIVAGTRP